MELHSIIDIFTKSGSAVRDNTVCRGKSGFPMTIILTTVSLGNMKPLLETDRVRTEFIIFRVKKRRVVRDRSQPSLIDFYL